MSVSNWEIAKKIIGPEQFGEKSPKVRTLANTKLTALTGLLIFALLAIEGVTIPFIGPLFSIHAFVGWVLVPPVLLKIISTSYRFVMYYTGNSRYVKAGPPKPLLRVIGPLIVVTTTILLWSGIEMVLLGPTGPGTKTWFQIHRIDFVLWFGLMTIHVLAYFLKAGSFALPEIAKPSGTHVGTIPGRNIRLILVSASLIIGIILGFKEWHLAANWVYAFHNFTHHR